jgi:hypothetical protein
MVVNFKRIRSYGSSGIFQVLRIVLYLAGFFTSFWFFYSIVGIIIGLLYFLLHRDPSWKRHGLMLAFISSITDVLAHRLPILPPLRMATVIAPTTLVVYLVGTFAYTHWLESKRHPTLSISRVA